MPCPVAPLLPFLLAFVSLPYYWARSRLKGTLTAVGGLLENNSFQIELHGKDLIAQDTTKGGESKIVTINPADIRGTVWKFSLAIEREIDPRSDLLIYSSDQLSSIQLKVKNLRLLDQSSNLFIYGNSSAELFHISEKLKRAVLCLVAAGSEVKAVQLSASSGKTQLSMTCKDVALYSLTERILNITPELAPC